MFTAQLKVINAAIEALAPSSVSANVGVFKTEQRERPIYNGRDGFDGPPITLYSSIFAELKDNLANLSAVTPNAEELGQVGKLFHVSSKVYENERERIAGMLPMLKSLLHTTISLHVTQTEAKVTPDGSVFAVTEGNNRPIVLLEWKNELGISGDPSLHIALTYRKHIAQKIVRLVFASST